jgi:hypothetical protein
VDDSDEPCPRSNKSSAHPLDVQSFLELARLALEDSSIGHGIFALVQEPALARTRGKEKQDQGSADKGRHSFDDEEQFPSRNGALDLDNPVGEGSERSAQSQLVKPAFRTRTSNSPGESVGQRGSCLKDAPPQPVLLFRIKHGKVERNGGHPTSLEKGDQDALRVRQLGPRMSATVLSDSSTPSDDSRK